MDRLKVAVAGAGLIAQVEHIPNLLAAPNRFAVVGVFDPSAESATESLEAAQARMAATAVNTRWQEFMAPFFESPNNARPDEMFLELTEIFHLD